MTPLDLFAVAAASAALSSAVADGRLATPAGAHIYDYADQQVYPVLATPGRITDIVLEPGETLTGPIAAGDTARWIIGDTASGVGVARRVHVLVKPTAAPLATNLIITSDRRTYHLELRASARTWLSEVAWRYAPPPPATPVILVAAPSVAAKPPVLVISLAYRLKGDHPPWRPRRVFDDGRRTYVEFDDRADLTALPPLYLAGEDGDLELTNYQVVGRTLVVERLFDIAELRLGAGKSARRVRIVREAGKAGGQ